MTSNPTIPIGEVKRLKVEKWREIIEPLPMRARNQVLPPFLLLIQFERRWWETIGIVGGQKDGNRQLRLRTFGPRGDFLSRTINLHAHTLLTGVLVRGKATNKRTGVQP